MTAYIAPPPIKTNANYKGFTPGPSTHENYVNESTIHRSALLAGNILGSSNNSFVAAEGQQLFRKHASELNIAIGLRRCVPNVIEITALEAPGRATFLIRTGSISVLNGSKRDPRYALLEDAIFEVVRFNRHCSRYFSLLGFQCERPARRFRRWIWSAGLLRPSSRLLLRLLRLCSLRLRALRLLRP